MLFFRKRKRFDRIKKHFHNLFVPHRGNNHRSKLLHHNSLSKIVILLLVAQCVITLTTRAKPGVLGFASNITQQDILSLTNKERVAEGLDPLSLNDSLNRSAAAKAKHMFEQDYWAHNAPDGTTPWYFFRAVDYQYLYAGENLARDFGDSVSTVQAWMDSPTHRENIMSGRYDEIGIGVVNGILGGEETTLVVQHFGKQASPQVVATEEEAASAVAGEQAEIPEIAIQEKVDELVEETEESTAQIPEENITPSRNISAFQLTKLINLIISGIIIAVLFVDGYIIWTNKIERRTGKNLIHLSLIVLVMLIVLLTQSGKII